MSNELSTSSALEGDHVKGFVTSYAKCWEHYEAYMQNPDHTYQGFIAACEAEAAEQGIEIKLPAPKTFANRMTKLLKAGDIPERTVSDKPEAVRQRKHRASVTNSQIGKMSHVPPTTYKHDFNPVQDTTVLEPRVLDADVVEDSQEWESVVSMGTEADRDYQECLELFQQLFKITGKYITGGWSEQQWNALGGECRTLEDGCNIHSANLRKAIERDVRGFSDALNAARTQSICQSSSNTGS